MQIKADPHFFAIKLIPILGTTRRSSYRHRKTSTLLTNSSRLLGGAMEEEQRHIRSSEKVMRVRFGSSSD